MPESNATNRIEVTPLGQAGFRLHFASLVIYIDPYLSDSVERCEGPDLRRLVPIWKAPESIVDADWVLITHAHVDHCDVETLVPLAQASPHCRFVGPPEVMEVLTAHDIAKPRLVSASLEWLTLGKGVRVHPVPAAHPEVALSAQGEPRCVGYVIEFRGRRIYHSGDTSLDARVVDAVCKLKPISTAILPVNERNYYRDRRGIIGNMSIREAFGFAQELEVETLIPMHWDMFAPNCVFREEIEACYRLSGPPFRMLIEPTEI